jgi:transcriptional regulator with PAS, ATPase and Fis domain
MIKNLFGDAKTEDAVRAGSDEREYGEDLPVRDSNGVIQDTEEIVEESLSLSDKEIELIKKALERHNHKRKLAARELGISERTLYRKIKEYGIEM